MDLDEPAFLFLAKVYSTLLYLLDGLLFGPHVLLDDSQLLPNLFAALVVYLFEVVDGVSLVLAEHLALAADRHLALTTVVVLHYPVREALLVEVLVLDQIFQQQ